MLKKVYTVLASLMVFAVFASNFAYAEEVDIKKIREQLPKLLGANNAGTEFVFGFHPAWEESGPNNALKIYVSSAVPTQVRLTIPAFGDEPIMIKTVMPNDITEFSLQPATGQPYSRGGGGQTKTLEPTQVWRGRGIIVEADAPIICYGVTRYRYTSDGFLAVPTHALSKKYIVSAYRETADFNNQSLTPYADIIGVFDKTKVTFSFGGNNNAWIRTLDGKKWKPTDVLSTQLNRGDFWLIASEGAQSDLGGSLVSANKPIAVLSGSHCAYIPTQNSACDFIIEQELPLIAWGKKYHVTNIVDRKYSSMIRIFVKEPGTTYYKNGVEQGTIYSNWGIEDIAWIERRATSENEGNVPSVYSADKPFNVVQYNTGMSEDGIASDPFQMMLTPVEQFQNEIIFNTPGIRGGYGFTRNYINVVYMSDSTGAIPNDLELGEVTPTGEVKWTKIIDLSGAPGSQFNDPDQFGKKEQYFNKIIKLPYDGVYKLHCGSQKIAAYAYGFAEWDSYGFPTSIALADLEKPDTVTPIPTYQMFCDGSTLKDYENPRTTTGLVMDMPDEDLIRSNMSIILLDRNNSYNYEFGYDDFIPGESRYVKWYLRTIDPNQDARAIITFADRAGNDTTIEVKYNAVKLSITPKKQYFGNLKIGESKTFKFVIKNESKVPTNIAYLQELILQSQKEGTEDKGFKLSFDPEIINIPLGPGETRPFDVKFTATKEGEFRDSIGVGDNCFFQYKSLVQASVGTPIINVSDIDFGEKTVGFETSPMIATITNTGTTSLAITGFVDKTLSVYKHDLPKMSDTDPLIIDKGGSYQFQVWFTPDAVKSYPDSIVFISDAPTQDPVCVIRGEGIEPQLEATGFNWDRRRAHLARYDADNVYEAGKEPYPYLSENKAIELKNPGSKEVSIAKINILEDIKGEAFEIMVNGTLQPIKNYINNIGSIKDEAGQSILTIEKEGYRYIPVYFHPKDSGDYKLVLEYESDAPVKPTSTLEGKGVYPVIATENVDYGTKVIGDVPATQVVKFTNTQWSDYADAVTIKDLVVAPDGTISAVLGNVGTEGFGYDRAKVRFGMQGTREFPITLQPGEYIEIDGEFAPEKTGNAVASIGTLSDAATEAISNWIGFGIAEGLELIEGERPYICYNTTDEITLTLHNTGSDSIDVNANGVTIINDPNNVFSIKGLYRTDLTEIDPTNSFTLAPDEAISIVVTFYPKTWKEVNVQEYYEAAVQVNTNAVTPSLKTLTSAIKGDAIHYADISSSKINGQSQVIVDPGQDVKKTPITYSIYLQNSDIQNAQKYDYLANPTEITISVQYEKNFLAVREKDNGDLMINVGADLPAGWTVKSAKLKLEESTNIETIEVVLTGAQPFQRLESSQIVTIEFLAWLPWYNNNGQIAIKAKTVEFTHTVSTNEQCVQNSPGETSQASLTPTCVDNLRPIEISASDYNLGMVSPNPVGGNGTEVDFSIAFTGFVNIRIIDATGNVVAEPINENMKAGNYTVRIPADKMANGTYILEMRSGEFHATRNINIVK